jgi:AcrR family transcriptional regulator
MTAALSRDRTPAPPTGGAEPAESGRRLPQQRRSRAKVDAVLDAAEQLLAEAPLEAVTTTAVALRAGIAVGTLYQYFEGMPTVIDALVARHTEAFGAHLEDALRGQRLARKRDAANAALDALIDYYRAHPAFRALWRGAPGVMRSGLNDGTDFFMGIVVDAIFERDLVEPSDAFTREVRVQWAVTSSLLQVAFELDPDGDPTVIEHLRKLFALDIVPVD